MARSLNRVQLIGNLTRDPELRYTPQGTAVCTFGLATNRSWTTDSGEKHEETEFHRIVAWNKLAELCSQFLVKGRKVYVEGRLATRSWTGQDGQQKSTTEVVIDDMILLDSKGQQTTSPATSEDSASSRPAPKEKKPAEAKAMVHEEPAKEAASDEDMVPPDDIPF
ncbi:MAG TPA: single-stranded DNA-binding protein [Patescibacteria group bacterium]|nr:single-stranded DNA-binding protein [Patescibacteria group bacterium]